MFARSVLSYRYICTMSANGSVFFFIFFSGILGILVAFILVFANKNLTLAPRLLGLYLFLFSMVILHTSLIYTDFFLHYPYLWRSTSSATFIAPAVAYLYVRSVLYQSFKLKKTDWILLFVPAGLYTLNMLPLFTLPASEKLKVVSQLIANRAFIAKEPDGWLPLGWGIAARMIHGLALLTAQYVMLFNMRQRVTVPSHFIKQNQRVFRWLFFFTTVLSLFYVVVTIEYILHFNIHAGIVTPIFFTLAGTVLFISLYLLTKPAILYGIQGWIPGPKTAIEENRKESNAETDDDKKPYLTIEQGKAYKLILESHLNSRQPFLVSGYKIKDLCSELNIPFYQLSAFINQEYGKNFNELMNEYRVAYLSKLLKTSPAYLLYTLDALAKQAGFNSRNSLFMAVKKISGQTPTDYFGLKTRLIPS